MVNILFLLRRKTPANVFDFCLFLEKLALIVIPDTVSYTMCQILFYPICINNNLEQYY